MTVHPLIFEPILKPKIWGGRKLATLLRKRLPEGQKIGESWELADLEGDQSVVTVGPARGKTLRQLVQDWGAELTGRAPLFDGRFPLLIKFLDANETLSVQVHPDEATAKRLGGRVRVKNEAWYVIDTEPDGFIYRGVRSGVDANTLVRVIKEKRVESVLNHLQARKGHCYYLPSGTIHALGAGVTVAEVQTPSDITYRVYDWDRADPSTGSPRLLHLQEALQCVSFVPVPPETEQPQHAATVWSSVTSLVRCDSFVIERVRMGEGVEYGLSYQKMVIWMILEGGGDLSYDGAEAPISFGAGDTVVLPAALRNGHVKITADCLRLEISVPVPSPLGEFERPNRAALLQPSPAETSGVTQLQVPDRSGRAPKANKGPSP